MTEYDIELEIFEGSGGEPRPDGTCPDFAREGICAWMHGGPGERNLRVGDRFSYPEDIGLLCPWLLDSLTGFIRALEHGGTLPWRYRGTPYEKALDPEGVTTEFIRCPDPTASGIVVKLTRTALPET
ncbi:MAG: hypothetical protein MUE66_06205 [Acidimicrobiia bacterium]|nr:hypothetical protein [Acidimicrobiia bacterium]